MTIFVLVAAIVGFFPYNYHPAIIYLGDTGGSLYWFYDWCLIASGFEKCNGCSDFIASYYPFMGYRL